MKQYFLTATNWIDIMSGFGHIDVQSTTDRPGRTSKPVVCRSQISVSVLFGTYNQTNQENTHLRFEYKKLVFKKSKILEVMQSYMVADPEEGLFSILKLCRMFRIFRIAKVSRSRDPKTIA